MSTIFAETKRRIKGLGVTEYIDLCWASEGDAIIYVRISGILGADNEFAGGEYIAEVVMGPEYPGRPPHVRFLTPNGVTQVGVFISINRFGYHDEGYTVDSGAYGVAKLLPAVLIQWRELGPGAGLLTPSIEAIKAAAKDSKRYNAAHNKAIVDLL